MILSSHVLKESVEKTMYKLNHHAKYLYFASKTNVHQIRSIVVCFPPEFFARNERAEDNLGEV